MADAVTTDFSEFVLKIGDGGDPETFNLICGITSRSFNIEAETSETKVPDCTDEDKPFTKVKRVTAVDWNISGNGVMADQVYDVLRNAALSGESINVQVHHAKAAPTGGHYEGAALLTNLGHEADKEAGIVTVAVSFEGASKLTWVDAT